MARPAPAVTRAIRFIDLLVTHPDDRFTLSQLVERTGISLGSAHAVLAALEDEGYVRRHPVHKTYGLGPALVAAGVAALDHQPAVAAATAEAELLAERIGVETAVTAVTRNEIVFLAHAGRPSVNAPQVRNGERVPLVPPLGAVFMAWAAETEIAAWLDRAPRSAAERDRNRAMLDVVRSRGFAIGTASPAQRVFADTLVTLTDDPRRDELRARVDELVDALATDDYELSTIEPQATYSVGMVASPVFDGDGRVVVALVAMGFEPSLTAAEVLAAGEAVRAGAVVATRTSRGRLPDVA